MKLGGICLSPFNSHLLQQTLALLTPTPTAVPTDGELRVNKQVKKKYYPKGGISHEVNWEGKLMTSNTKKTQFIKMFLLVFKQKLQRKIR